MADPLREVEVADGHGVGVAESALADLGRGPDADARQRPQGRRGVGRRPVDQRLEPAGAAGGGDQGPGPGQVDAGPVPVPRRHPRDRPGVGGDVEVGRQHLDRAGRPVAVPPHEGPPGGPRLATGHLLLQHRGGQCFQHPPRARHPPAAVGPERVAQRRVAHDEAGAVESLDVVEAAEQRRQTVEDPLGAGPPRGADDLAVDGAHREPQGRGSFRRPGRAPEAATAACGPVVPERRVAAAPAQRAERGTQVERPTG